MFGLEEKKALVCGSTQGIGRAAAVALAELGANVTLVARDESKLKDVQSALPNDNQTHGHICADFTEPEQLADRVAQYVAANGPVDILVNNTGGPKSGPITDAQPQAFIDALTQHVLCNQRLAQVVIPGMKDRKYGRIVNIISTSVRAPIPGLGVSNTTRAAVANWAKTLAGELAAHGITVNNVLPGYTDTARLGSLFEAKANRLGSTAEAVREQTISRIPMQRLADPSEIAAAVAFLASPAASYISGVDLAVDGARTAVQ